MKFKRMASVLVLLTAANAPVVEPYAVVCEGTANFFHNGIAPKRMPTGKQVFVIDIPHRRVTIALEPRQIFAPVCVADGIATKANISPRIITVRQFSRSFEGNSETCSFELDRRNGNAKYELSLENQNRKDGFKWFMNCQRTMVPVFNTNGNKF